VIVEPRIPGALALGVSNLDFDNMTIDELLAQGTEKLKGMTIQQLKDFMNSGDTSTEGTEEELAQEAFFLTRGNIGKELDIHLRKTLGVLNDSEMEIGTLCTKFRKQGKRLNHVVHKASKMTDVFNEGERKQLLKLNALLSDLMAMMRADLDPQGVQAVKRLIKAFVQQATGVAKLVEQKQPGKPVQEGFFDKWRKKDSDKETLPSDPDEALSAIEEKLGGKLPDEFKKLFKSKTYQDMIGSDIVIPEAGDPDDYEEDETRDTTYTLFDASEILYHTEKYRDLFDKRSMIQIANVEHGACTIACADDGVLYEITRTWTSRSQYHSLDEFMKTLHKHWKTDSSKPGKPVQESASPDDRETDLPFGDLMKGEGYPIKEGSEVPIDFFGQRYMVKISAYEDETIKRQAKLIGEFMVKSKDLFDDSVRKHIRDIMEKCKSEFTDEELKTADWDHPEKHMQPKYLYVNDTKPHAPRTDGRYDWRIMIDCDWDFDEEHGLAIMFDENLKYKAIGQCGDYI
jgi:hypothetical protein